MTFAHRIFPLKLDMEVIYIYATEFWKITHMGVHETIRILMFN